MKSVKGAVAIWTCLALFLSTMVMAEKVAEESDTPAKVVEESDLPPVPEVTLPFPVGEKLTYTIYWGWIAVGESVATTSWEWNEEEEAWKLVIRFRTVTNSVLTKLYPVDDTIESILDPETLRPEKMVVKINEGKTRRDELTVFDWETMQGHFTKFHDDKDDEKESFELAEGTRDLVSFMYFMRNTSFEKGKTYDYKVMTDAKIYDLNVKGGKEQKIKLDKYDKVKSRRLDPKASFEGIFVRKGKMILWVAEEERQVMTKMFIDTPFANVRILLKSVEGPESEGLWEKD